MKKLFEYINNLAGIIALLAFVGIGTLYNLLDKLPKDGTKSNLVWIWIGIVFLLIVIALTLFAYIIYGNRLKNNKAFLIEKNLDNYIKGEGLNFLRLLREENKNEKKDEKLIAKTRQSIKMLIKKGTTNTLESDEYYMYLFALLDGATKRIWAASIVGAEEWIDTREEEEFLRLNINASRKKVLVERIFILKKQAIKDFLENKAIKTQIDKRNDYLKTYIIIEEELIKAKPNLLTDIGSGFLAFDDFAIATDVFQDNYIRGQLTLEEESISRNNRIFTNLRDYAKPLDKDSLNYFKTL